MSRVEPVEPGTRLRGTISWLQAFGLGGGLESGGVTTGGSTTFHPDGTYEGSSFGSTFGTFTGGGGFTTAREGETGGTYEVRDGIVVMTPNDGSPPRQ